MRWPAGFLFAGHHKLQILRDHLTINWPYTTTDPHPLWLGLPRTGHGAADLLPQWQDLENILDGADLIYDATADPAVNDFLSRLASTAGIPYVVVSATEGGWGGYVFRSRSEVGYEACQRCLLHHFEDHEQLLPPRDEERVARRLHRPDVHRNGIRHHRDGLRGSPLGRLHSDRRRARRLPAGTMELRAFRFSRCRPGARRDR